MLEDPAPSARPAAQAPAPPKRRRGVPGARRFAAGALASFVALFGVLALRVHDGKDPALGSVASSSGAAGTTTSSSTSANDPYDASGTSSDDHGLAGTTSSGATASGSPSSSAAGMSATPGASTSAS